MKLFDYFKFRDLGSGSWDQDHKIEPVGRGLVSRRYLHIGQMPSGHGSPPLRNEIKERFFTKEALNDKIKNGCASRVEKRNPAYKSNISQNDEMNESNIRRAECPSFGHSAESNQASKTGGVHNRSGFRPTGLNDENAGGHGNTLRALCPPLLKDTKERFFAKEAQNDENAGGHGNPSHRSGTLTQGTAGVRSVRRENKIIALNDGMKERFFAKEAQNDEMKERIIRRAECPSFGHSAEPNQVRKTGGVHNRSGFRPTGLNDRIAGKHGGLPLPLLLCLMLLLLVVSPVGAQVPPTRLFFNPTPLQIDTTIDPTGVVTLEVADGVDIFAFDLFVQYDPSLLSVSQVMLGDFLGEGLFCMDTVNEPGLVHYSCTRWAVDYGVTGSGVLLELTFEALGQGGDTILSLGNSEIYDWNLEEGAQPVYPMLEDGAVSVRPYLTFLPLILSASGQGTEVLP